MRNFALTLVLLLGCEDKGGDSALVDADGDGFGEVEDCDDADPAIHPEAEELDDDLDNDCDGVADEYLNLYDGDGDGWTEAGGDCDDADPSTNPDSEEVAGDGADNDCDDLTDETAEQEDDDGDGYSEEDGDCDDADDTFAPDAEELEDQLDNDCDGTVDEGTRLYDDDGDGFTETYGDCDDDNASAYPGGEDIPYDGVDGDCGYDDDYDADGDGQASIDYEGDDCNDTDPSIYLGAAETCDGADQSCDGVADDGLLGFAETCPAPSCLLASTATLGAADGLYWVDPLDGEPREVWCDMAGGGWTLVARATNGGGVVENATLDDGAEIGELPITPDSSGNNKLSDDLINALRLGALPNDLKIVVLVGGEVLGESWHPQDCVLQTGVEVVASDPCNASTTGGPDDLDYLQSEADSPLGRWGVDETLGYTWSWPGVALGPVDGGTDHAGELPDPYCTWYDEASLCPVATAIELWAL